MNLWMILKSIWNEKDTLNFFHRDPFDRLIIAQGLTECHSIVSKDRVFDEYGVKRLWSL